VPEQSISGLPQNNVVEPPVVVEMLLVVEVLLVVELVEVLMPLAPPDALLVRITPPAPPLPPDALLFVLMPPAPPLPPLDVVLVDEPLVPPAQPTDSVTLVAPAPPPPTEDVAAPPPPRPAASSRTASGAFNKEQPAALAAAKIRPPKRVRARKCLKTPFMLGSSCVQWRERVNRRRCRASRVRPWDRARSARVTLSLPEHVLVLGDAKDLVEDDGLAASDAERSPIESHRLDEA
jgi:hypothetical protein